MPQDILHPANLMMDPSLDPSGRGKKVKKALAVVVVVDIVDVVVVDADDVVVVGTNVFVYI